MSAPPRGIMTFSGIEQIERGSFVLTQGITPSVATLEILPQDASELASDGTLTLLFGDIEINFFDCKIDKASFDYGPDGMVWRLQIWDRRWKWRFAGPFGPVGGWWNQRVSSVQPAPQQWQVNYAQIGSLNPDTVMTPQLMAAALLDALGEIGYDVSNLPNNNLPEVIWDMDNPAQALEALCEQLGCRVCLNLDDSVSIEQIGIGTELPADQIERESAVVDPPEVPDSIALAGGRNRYQVDFLLEPVGLDTDGTIRYIWDLSYAPVNLLPAGQQPNGQNQGGWGQVLDLDPEIGFQEIAGWEVQDVIPPLTPPNLANLFQIGAISPQMNPRYLARQTVWRWYRISVAIGPDNSKSGPLIPGWGVPYGGGPNYPTVPPNQPGGRKDAGNPGGAPPVNPKAQWGTRLTQLWQILPIEDKQINGWYDALNNFTPYPAVVYGYYWSPSWDNLNAPNQPATQDGFFNFITPVMVGVEYSIDRNRGLVMFQEPMVRWIQNTLSFQAALIYLRCTVSPRFFGTSAPDRFYLERDLGGGLGTGPRIVKHDEIVRQVVPLYDQNFNVIALSTNDNAVVAEADYALDAALLEYQTTTPVDVTYMGLVPIGVDGSITQVSWTVGPEGATTRVAKDTEVHFAVPTFRERSLMASLANTTATTRTLQKQERRQ